MIVFFVVIASKNVFAYDNVIYETTSSNDTFGTAQNLGNNFSEATIKGTFPSGDQNDYYKFNATKNDNMYIHLSSIPTGCDYDFYLYDKDYVQLAYSNTSQDFGEFFSYTAPYTGTYYVLVRKWGGTPPANSRYKLFIKTQGETFNHSFYVTNTTSTDYMRYLGRDHTNNLEGIVILSFGRPMKQGSVHGVQGYNDSFLSYSQITQAVNAFISGYNEHPKHTAKIKVVVGVTNQRGMLVDNTVEWYNNGKAFKEAVLNISYSKNVTEVFGGYDAEMGWNDPLYTKELARGFSETGAYRRLYNYGSHNGATYDWSGETDPSWSVKDDFSSRYFQWKASDVYYLSWGLSCAYCMPQIYNDSHVKRWTYQKKWRAFYFDGLLSTNKWSEFSSALYSNQESYANFYNFLNQNGIGEPLEYRTWIALPSQYN